ncbi:MAG: hypothetical protein R3C68_19220, partial [Myxococcota bacterium]
MTQAVAAAYKYAKKHGTLGKVDPGPETNRLIKTAKSGPARVAVATLLNQTGGFTSNDVIETIRRAVGPSPARRVQPSESVVATGDAHGTLALVFVDKAAVERALPKGLVLEPVAGVPKGKHPV